MLSAYPGISFINSWKFTGEYLIKFTIRTVLLISEYCSGKLVRFESLGDTRDVDTHGSSKGYEYSELLSSRKKRPTRKTNRFYMSVSNACQRLTNQRSDNADRARAWKCIGNNDKNFVKAMRRLKERKMWHVTLCNVTISIARYYDQ